MSALIIARFTIQEAISRRLVLAAFVLSTLFDLAGGETPRRKLVSKACSSCQIPATF